MVPEWLTVSGLRQKWRQMVIPSWMISTIVHTVVLLILSFMFMEPTITETVDDLETELANIPEQPNLDEIQIDPLPLEPPQTMDIPAPQEPSVASVAVADAAVEAASMSPVDMPALDSMANLLEGMNPTAMAAKGAGGQLNSRGQGMRQAMVGSQGGTKQTEQAVHAGLDWLLRHQYPDGHWSLHQSCRQGRCSGVGSAKHDMAGTAFGLLPFLAAGYTHKSGPYQKQIGAGLTWMIANQDPQSGSLAKASGENMYVHGLASIVLAEAYALTRDARVGAAAQKAVRFIEYAQNPSHGGWRYTPKSPTGDTSVVGWQLMALKSAYMGGLEVKPQTFDLTKKFLKSVSFGKHGGRFGYDGPGGGSPAMTAVGLLCQQYLGAVRGDEGIREGVEFLKANPPSLGYRNAYYWYYATQVMHNMQGAEWDRWNREMRTIWVETQDRDKGRCEFGSWDPDKPAKDVGHSETGGRVMLTSIGLLTLEVYYRYLPLYKVMDGDKAMAAAK